MILERAKLMVEIKGTRVLVEGFHHNADGGHFGRIPRASRKGIHQEESSEMLAAEGQADCQPSKQSCGKQRVTGELPGDGCRQLCEVNAEGGEGVVASEGIALVH